MKRGERLEVSKEALQYAKQAGALNCPQCKTPMKLLTTSKNDRNEFYCEPCHCSVPMW